jgi:hypothetical protein
MSAAGRAQTAASHYPWEDTADEYAALVTAWWQGGYANIEK